MCNPMHVPTNKIILNIIMNNTDKQMPLDETLKLVNKNLPTPKKVTRVSFCNKIHSMSREGFFSLITLKKDRAIYYTFKICKGGNNDNRGTVEQSEGQREIRDDIKPVLESGEIREVAPIQS